jgi:hypothetical protein
MAKYSGGFMPIIFYKHKSSVKHQMVLGLFQFPQCAIILFIALRLSKLFLDINSSNTLIYGLKFKKTK